MYYFPFHEKPEKHGDSGVEPSSFTIAPSLTEWGDEGIVILVQPTGRVIENKKGGLYGILIIPQVSSSKHLLNALPV